ncbi:hypothetical protein GTA08_BOTSDO13087 [Botryosphaeria dothidea]|uniref:Uncharacterized protein n=1 Tax=Botryosphaeria dothidea TaxID=55169 RepID=A0A8H4J185_9PEZI|nr:hypothetical protein GTA08_BOTSDO13087 [Botryosphaeria dothidea]
MQPNKHDNSHQDHQQGAGSLPESVTSSETSFGSFIVPEAEHEVAGGYPEPFPTDVNLLPPDEGLCAANMLNLEIVAHAHTEIALQAANTRASHLERHYTHQSMALAAWQNAYQDCLARTQSQTEEIARLKQKVEDLKAEIQSLLEGIDFWRDTARPASA